MPTKTKNKKVRVAKKRPVKKSKTSLWPFLLLALLVAVAGVLTYRHYHDAKKSDLSSFQATPLYKVKPLVSPRLAPSGISPAKIKSLYGIGGSGGSGTIAIVDAYDDPTLEADLAVFSSQYGLSACTTVNSCFEKHKMSDGVAASSDWAVEEALDTEWAHAIAPNAKILIVEANSASGTDLIDAVNYARNRSDVVAVSMSWGGNEFSTEASYEANFTSAFGASFFASSGDSGHGTGWPAVSANVISVGGTKLNFNSRGTLTGEVAWTGSGGGISRYISEPLWQKNFTVPLTTSKRAVPDVSYDADPASGFPVYDSTPYSGSSGWFLVGGTSAGAPQWAAIKAISHSLTSTLLYTDAAKPRQTYLRDITSGRNGFCGSLCMAKTGYDYVTGLGSPLTTVF